MTIIERAKKPTPKFFRTLRTIGLCLGAAAGVVLSGGVAAPAIAVTIASYMATASAVAVAVSQVAVKDETE